MLEAVIPPGGDGAWVCYDRRREPVLEGRRLHYTQGIDDAAGLDAGRSDRPVGVQTMTRRDMRGGRNRRRKAVCDVIPWV